MIEIHFLLSFTKQILLNLISPFCLEKIRPLKSVVDKQETGSIVQKQWESTVL